MWRLYVQLSLFFFVLPSITLGQSSGSFVVRPAKVELSGKPGETVLASILLENKLGTEATFTIGFEDVEGSENPDDGVVLLGTKRGPYSLRDLMRAPRSVTLRDGEERRLSVSIVLPADLSPGGLYGSVVFTPLRGGVNEQIVPDSRIGVLFFVKVEGESLLSGGLKNFVTKEKNVYWGKPTSEILARMEYENTGTVHLNPYGEIRLSRLFGEESTILVDPWYVLPKSFRARDVSLGEELSYGWNGVSVTLNRGYEDIIDESSFSIWVLPSPLAVGVTLGIAAILVLAVLRRGRSIHVV